MDSEYNSNPNNLSNNKLKKLRREADNFWNEREATILHSEHERHMNLNGPFEGGRHKPNPEHPLVYQVEVRRQEQVHGKNISHFPNGRAICPYMPKRPEQKGQQINPLHCCKHGIPGYKECPTHVVESHRDDLHHKFLSWDYRMEEEWITGQQYWAQVDAYDRMTFDDSGARQQAEELLQRLSLAKRAQVEAARKYYEDLMETAKEEVHWKKVVARQHLERMAQAKFLSAISIEAGNTRDPEPYK